MSFFKNMFGAKEQPPMQQQYQQPVQPLQQPIPPQQPVQPETPPQPAYQPQPPMQQQYQQPVQPKEVPKKDMIHKKIAALEVLKQLKMKRAIIAGAIACLVLTTLAKGSGWLLYVRYGAFIVGFAGAAVFFTLNERFAKQLMAKYNIK